MLCLLWNVIAVTAAWIKGEGEFRYVKEGFIRLFNITDQITNLTSTNPMHVDHALV